MDKRIKNTADLSTYVKVFKSNMEKWTMDFMKPDLEDVSACYHDLIEELHEKTPRVTKEMLLAAARKVFPEADEKDVNFFAMRLNAACQMLREKSRTSSSCKKLSPKIRSLVAQLKKQANDDCRKPSPSPETNTTAAGSGSSSSNAGSSSSNSRDDIYVAFGVIPPSGHVKAHGMVNISDSSEDELPSNLKSGSNSKLQSLEWFDAREMVQKRLQTNGDIIKATMFEGPSGFLTATFPGEAAKQLEIPNIAILPVVSRICGKRPAAALKRPAAMKRPSFVEEQDAEVEEMAEEGEEEPQEVDSTVEAGDKGVSPVIPRVLFKYSSPYRYPNGTWAVRRLGSVSKKQVASARGKVMTETKVKTVMLDVSARLNDGRMSECDVKDWLAAKVK